MGEIPQIAEFGGAPMTTTTMATAFSQRDPRWAREVLGSSGLTLGEAGCLVTAVASLLADFSGCRADVVHPGRLNGWLAEHGGFVEGGQFVFGAVEPLGARLRAYVDYYATPANLARLAKALAAGWGALALVDARPGCDIQAHWVRVLAIQPRDCVIMDPWQAPGEEIGSLNERYGCKGWHGGRAIFVYVGYEPVALPPGAIVGAARSAEVGPVQAEVCWRPNAGRT